MMDSVVGERRGKGRSVINDDEADSHQRPRRTDSEVRGNINCDLILVMHNIKGSK